MNQFWTDRRVFLTGASGLVGGWLAKRLIDARADVVCLVRDWVPQSNLFRTGLKQQVNIVWGDVCDSQLLDRALAEYEIQTVIHLCAQTIVPIANRNPISTFETNIAGTWRLLEACRRNPTVKEIVVASSDKAYGTSETGVYREELPLCGRHPYDVSKSCADLIAQAYAATYDLPVVVSRCGNFFGGGDLNWNRLVPGTIRSVLRGQQPVIRSDGRLIRDYIYVEDGAAAYMLLAERLANDSRLSGQAFNFSSETRLTVLDMVRSILQLMESRLEPDIRAEVSNEIGHQCLDTGKARQLLGWAPAFNLEEGLRRTIDWYTDFLDTTNSTNGHV